jgi:hypothetical protein
LERGKGNPLSIFRGESKREVSTRLTTCPMKTAGQSHARWPKEAKKHGQIVSSIRKATSNNPSLRLKTVEIVKLDANR